MGIAPNTPVGVASSRAGSPAGQLPRAAAVGQGWADYVPSFSERPSGLANAHDLVTPLWILYQKCYLSNPTLKSKVTGKQGLVAGSPVAGL